MIHSREWVVELPCTCVARRPSKSDGSPDKRFAWEIWRIEEGWDRPCWLGHHIGDKLPNRNPASKIFSKNESHQTERP